MPEQDVTVELYYDSAWHDITADDDVFTAPIVIKRGQSDEATQLRPASIAMQLANDDDKYRTSNPVSPLYGKAGRNTPMRVSVGGTVRGVVEASSWAADQSRDFRRYPKRGKAWVDVEGGGLLQRVGQWTQPLRSALYRYVDKSGVTPAEWWPMEDVDGSAVAVNAAGGPSMTPVTTARYTLPDGSVLPPGGAPRFADGAGIGGSDKLPNFQGGGTLAAPIRTATFNGYAIDWVMQFAAGTDDGGTSSADVLRWTESGTYVMFTVNVVKDHVTVFHANAADAETLSSTGSADAAIDMYDGAPHHFRYQVRQNGGNYKAELYVDSALYATADNFTPGMAGTVGVPTNIEWNPGEQRGDYMPIAAGHLIVWASGQIGGQPAVFFALNGYAGELAATRFGRLVDEELGAGNYYVSAGFADSMPMGAQRVDSLPNLLKEIVGTEGGLLFDFRSEARLYFLCRADRYNQTVALDLSPTDLPVLPVEVTDDLNVHNVVTASQRDGGDATAEDSTGPLGSQPPPDGVGEYKQTVDVNLDDPNGGLPQVANWWMRNGTVNLPRFPQVTVNMAALDADKVAEVEAVDVGDVITITGMREYVIRLIVIGYTETIRPADNGKVRRTIVFTCVPDQQFQVGVWDSTSSPWDSRNTTLKTSVSPSATSLTFRTTGTKVRWSTAGTPYDVTISGERLTVTTMGAASLVSGSYDQTATVARSVNGIVKALTAGDEIHVATPERWAL
jgi:hypothetical protein